jgi:hypothetical protein
MLGYIANLTARNRIDLRVTERTIQTVNSAVLSAFISAAVVIVGRRQITIDAVRFKEHDGIVDGERELPGIPFRAGLRGDKRFGIKMRIRARLRRRRRRLETTARPDNAPGIYQVLIGSGAYRPTGTSALEPPFTVALSFRALNTTENRQARQR